MSHAKEASKRKRRSKALPVLGAAGLSLSLASVASAAPGGPADIPMRNTGDGRDITLGEEEIADVSLATFYVFDKEDIGAPGPGIQLAKHGCGGCHGCGHGGGCHGCGGCHHGCGGHGCHGCGGCHHGCGCLGLGLWWGGCGGCGGCSGGYWCWRHGVRVWCEY